MKLLRRNIGRLGIVLTFVLLAAAVASAQFTLGTITGRVTDPSGSVVPGAQVKIQNMTTSALRATRTNSSGLYTFASLPPGTYEIKVSSQGFSEVRSEVQLGISQTLTQDFQLSVGSVSQQVTVQEATGAVSLQTESHTVSQLVTQKEITSLPVNGRNFLNLAVLGPGSQPGNDLINFSNNGGSAQYFQTTSSQVILAGQSVGHTTFLQDGVTNTQLFTQAVNIVPDMDAIQEFSVDSTGMSAKFGQPGVINAITKTGSNSFHGDLYDYFENSALNANNWFSNLHHLPIGQESYNQFGGTIGGPIRKDKLFFFFDYEGQRQIDTSSFAGLMPTAAWRQGDFSDYLTGIPCGPACTRTVTIYDPATYNPATHTAQPFQGNIIPTDRFSAFSVKYLQLFPLPNSAILPDGTNYHVNLSTTNNLNQYLGNVDYNISAKDRLFGEYEFYNHPTISNGFIPNLFGNTYQRVGTNIALEETHTLSPALLNTARFGYNRSIFFNSELGVGAKDWTSYFGLQNLHPAIQQNAPPGVSIAQCCGVGNIFAPQGAVQNLFQFADELDYIHGKHTISAGVEAQRIQFNGNWELANSGDVSFNGQYTSNYQFGQPSFVQGLGLADFMLGLPNFALGGVGNTLSGFRETDLDTYVQDDWRALPKLTLNLGFRYQYDSPPRDKYGHASTYSLSRGSSVPGSWDPNYRNLAPRVGLAYALRPSTVIRSGFGIYYTSTAYNELQFLMANPPNFLSQALSFSPLTPTPMSSIFPSFAPGSTIFAPFAVEQHNPTPYLEQWNFDVQRTLSKDILIDVGYVGNQGHHLSVRLNPNQAAPENPLNPTPIQSRRPYPAIGDILAQYDLGNSNYNALQASIRKTFSKGLSFQASYTWSRAFDLLSTDGGEMINGLDPKLNYGPSDFSRPQVLTLSYTYELPFGPGKSIYNRSNWVAKYLVGGWQVNGVTTFGSGLPFMLFAQDFSNTGSNHEFVPTRVCNGALSNPTVFQWFNTSCFAQPAPGFLGNAGRNILSQGKENNWDFSLFKDFRFTESKSLQIRGEFFNLFNQHSFVNPDVTVGDPQFGQMLSATSPRVAQLALKFYF